MDFHDDKTYYMKSSRRQQQTQDTINLNGYVYQFCEAFKYLGTLVTELNKVTREIKARIAARNCYLTFQNVLKLKCQGNMASKALLESFLTKVPRSQSSFFLAGALRKFHADAVAVPEVPLSLHDPNYFFIVPEDGSPLKLFEPELPEVNFNSIMRFFKEIGQNSRELKTKLFQRAAEVDIFLISTHAFQTAKEMPSRFNNYFISYDGVISVEKIVPIEKLKTNVREAGSKLTEFTNKLPISDIQQKWEIVKGKLPAWQNTIATKLQNFQDAINKRINPKKPD